MAEFKKVKYGLHYGRRDVSDYIRNNPTNLIKDVIETSGEVYYKKPYRKGVLYKFLNIEKDVNLNEAKEAINYISKQLNLDPDEVARGVELLNMSKEQIKENPKLAGLFNPLNRKISIRKRKKQYDTISHEIIHQIGMSNPRAYTHIEDLGEELKNKFNTHHNVFPIVNKSAEEAGVYALSPEFYDEMIKDLNDKSLPKHIKEQSASILNKIKSTWKNIKREVWKHRTSIGDVFGKADTKLLGTLSALGIGGSVALKALNIGDYIGALAPENLNEDEASQLKKYLMNK